MVEMWNSCGISRAPTWNGIGILAPVESHLIQGQPQPLPTAAPDPQFVREAEMISRILAGERELFYELIKPYERTIFITAYSVVRSEADAEEVAQEAMLKAYRALSSFRGDCKFSTWLVTIALNESRMKLRRARQGAEVSLEELVDDSDGDFTPAVLTDWREIPSEALDRKELRDMLQRTLGELPLMYREVLVMRDVRGLNIAEASELLGISHGMVKTRLFRARLMMQKLLAPKLRAHSKKML
jgi:RNA polymerase sigma-70 factor (ECF subfamily)